MALIRVFQLPPAFKPGFRFGGGEPTTFLEVDWFRDEHQEGMAPMPPVGSDAWKTLLCGFLMQKRYYAPGRAFLVLHPQHSFTINYEAP